MRMRSAESDEASVLICDDEPLLVAALTLQLEHLGLRCVSDTSSRMVHELARKHHPRVIVLDIHQQVDGRDLLQQLKKDPETARCKVLVLSGVEDQFTRQTCLALGAEDYVVKPFDSFFVRKVARLAGLDPRDPQLPA
jgi:CheY-like chemotaxis protein